MRSSRPTSRYVVVLAALAAVLSVALPALVLGPTAHAATGTTTGTTLTTTTTTYATTVEPSATHDQQPGR